MVVMCWDWGWWWCVVAVDPPLLLLKLEDVVELLGLGVAIVYEFQQQHQAAMQRPKVTSPPTLKTGDKAQQESSSEPKSFCWYY